MVKEGVGEPIELGPHVLYFHTSQGYVAAIGERCPVNALEYHTMTGVLPADLIVAYIGPLPDPSSLMGRLRN